MKSFIIFLAVIAIAASRHLDDFRAVNPLRDWRVVGGQPGSEGQFPFMISLRRDSPNHNCGGTIVNDRWILTAAHCVIGVTPSNLKVIAGIYLLTSPGTPYLVQSTFMNGYSPITHQNDIALLHLTTRIVFGPLVQPIPLETHRVDRSVEAILVGWGTTYVGGEVPNNIQYVSMNTTTLEECRSCWGSMIFDSSLCTQAREGYGACHGDSGGPLINKETGHQIAIVSWGFPCAIGLPDVFASVSYHDEWINAVIN